MILVILPYGTAILFGAASERWGGKNLSALLSMAGLALGPPVRSFYLSSHVMEEEDWSTNFHPEKDVIVIMVGNSSD